MPQAKKKKKNSQPVGLDAARNAAKKKKASNINKIVENDIMNATKPNFEKISSDAVANGKDHMEALMKTSDLLAKGGEELFKSYVAFAQSAAEKSNEGLKSLMGCKTINELTEAQNKLAQDSIETYVKGVTKLSELTVKVATDSFEPLTAQITKTVKKATEAVAA